jgi:hypothetical protein
MSTAMRGSPGRSTVVLLSALMAATTACEVDVDPIDVPPLCPEKPLRGPTAAADVPVDRLIDDFEDGNNFILPVAGRNGYWTSMDNGSSSVLSARASTSCAARDEWAGHFAAAGFTQYGASWTAYFSAPGPGAIPYDGHQYSGISFWAATGDGPTPFPVKLGVSTMDTITSYQYYGTTVELTHDWRRFVLPFSTLVQTGGGDRFPMRLEALVAFITWPEQGEFDIWIDDVRFEQ